MDFVAKEIFYLFWFSSMLGAFGKIIEPAPKNRAVLVGDKNVEITCNSSTSADAIKWSFKPVGSTEEKTIKNGAVITDRPTDFGGSLDTAAKSNTLTILTANPSTAGTYSCDESGKKSMLLIVVLNGDVSCDYTPRDTKTRPCNSTLTLSCIVSYIAETTVVTANLEWSSNPETEDLVSPDTGLSPPDSVHVVTSTSTLVVTWPKEGSIPIYTCKATFRLFQGAIQNNKLMASKPPLDSHTCQPYASAVPCGGKDDPSMTTATGEKGEQSKDSSARSAETNNLAIRVLGVAGVSLLAQVL